MNVGSLIGSESSTLHATMVIGFRIISSANITQIFRIILWPTIADIDFCSRKPQIFLNET